MKIAMVNGSPKAGKSNSGWFLEKLEEQFLERHEIAHFNIVKKPVSDYRALCRMDALVFAFPLYIDAIPSHLLRMMVEMEKSLSNAPEKPGKAMMVYAIVNNGFFEGEQNHIALDIIKNWCARTGLCYGQGVGHGAGEMIGFLDGIPLGHGPLTNLGNALQALAQNIEMQKSGGDVLVSPNYPRVGWRFSAKHSVWHKRARKNGVKIQELKRQVV